MPVVNDMLYQVGEVQSVDAVSDNKVNRFNGTGVGIYATSYAQRVMLRLDSIPLNMND